MYENKTGINRKRTNRARTKSFDGVETPRKGRGTTATSMLLIPGSHPAEDLLPLRRALRGVGMETCLSLQRRPALTVVEQAAKAAEAVRASVAGPVHALGHSFGAVVALQLAADRPDLVRSLTLIEPSLMSVSSAAQFLTRLRRVAPSALEADLPSLLDWEFTDVDAARVGAPVMSVVTRPIRRVFLDGRAQIHAWFPWAEDLDVDGRGHLGALDNPHATAKGVFSFISASRSQVIPASEAGRDE